MGHRQFDVAVVGGGPAGYAAALSSARRGASVVLAEPELLGGTCVHWSCIPTNVLLASVHTSLEARELAFVGVLTAGDDIDLRALRDRRKSMVARARWWRRGSAPPRRRRSARGPGDTRFALGVVHRSPGRSDGRRRGALGGRRGGSSMGDPHPSGHRRGPDLDRRSRPSARHGTGVRSRPRGRSRPDGVRDRIRVSSRVARLCRDTRGPRRPSDPSARRGAR